MTTVADRPAASTEGARRARPTRRPKTGQQLRSISGLSLGVVVLWLTLLVLLPLIAVVGKSFDYGWSGFTAAVTNNEAAAALRLTIGLSAIVAVVNAIMGVVVGWVLVRERFPGARVFEMVIDIPFALPTVVAGVVMLYLYGGDSPVGINLSGARVGLFVVLLFVTLPFTVRTVQPVLLRLDREAEQAAASLGASPVAVFRRIVLPQLLPAVASGATLAFARAIGEYGSLVFISGNIQFKTEIASSLIYGKLQNNDTPQLAEQQASAIAALLLVVSAIVLVALDLVQRRVARRG
ncbi:sulfate ABC transporter permease subunit CysT [uncultured Jatrophihabitans sp.]|uniref:sulfate ABC transporter permease subunit CysT n=1 Tax=uncultured Jatrophihabitans sp. TaxID=1610747 RepID=UPI0035C997A2